MKFLVNRKGNAVIAVIVAILIPILLVVGLAIFASQRQAHAITQGNK